MGRWAQAHRRGSVLSGETRHTVAPPAPSIDFDSVDHVNGGFDVASQTVPLEVAGQYRLYVQHLGVGAFVLTDSASQGDGDPFFTGEGFTVTDKVYITEVGDGTHFVGESPRSNVETI